MATLPLTAEQARTLRGLARTAFAETGVEVVVHAGHVEDDQGSQVGLWNLAALCNDTPEREWPDVVRAHVSRLGRPEEVETMSEDALEQAIALANLLHFAMLGFREAPGPLSPNVFWVRGGRWLQVSRIVDEHPQVEIDEELAAAPAALGG